jgi:hypothetical protein
VFVLLQWAWHYVTYDRGSRLITETAQQWRLGAAEAIFRRHAEPTELPVLPPPPELPPAPEQPKQERGDEAVRAG